MQIQHPFRPIPAWPPPASPLFPPAFSGPFYLSLRLFITSFRAMLRPAYALHSIGQVVIKEWGVEIFRKVRPSPMLWEPFKVTVPSRTAVGFLETNCVGAHSSVSGLLFITYSFLQRNLGIDFQWCNEHFKPGMLLFSVGSSAMNAPRYWQRRNELLRQRRNSWVMRREERAYPGSQVRAPVHVGEVQPCLRLHLDSKCL